MTFLRLLGRNLLYHWRGNFAVFLGIALGAAVLTGALLVGDSLRGSLKALTLDQLGWVEHAMVPGRFFRVRLATEVSAEKRSAALLLQGNASHKKDDGVLQSSRVTVLGVDASFWPDDAIPESAAFWASDEREAIVNRSLAAALNAEVGRTITLNVQRADHAPAETLMGQRKAERVIEPLLVKVAKIVPDEGMARFSLKPSPQPAPTAFVPIRFLQKRLDLEGRANVLLAARAGATLQADLQPKLKLEDWGLRFRTPKDRAEAFLRFLGARSVEEAKLKEFKWRGHVPDALAKAAEKNGGVLTTALAIDFYEKFRDYSVLESTRMLLEPQVVRAIEKLDPRATRWRRSPILIYLADSIEVNRVEIPYAIIASDDLQDRDGKPVIADDQILLTDWPGSPWKVKREDPVKVSYYFPNERNELVKRTETFKLHSLPLPMLEGVLDDPDLTPEFPGITDQLKMSDWQNPPFPYDKERGKQGEPFWKRYKTTPRAYVNLAKAQAMWGTRFGNLTSIQFRMGEDSPSALPDALLKELKPEDGGFVFQPVRAQALEASGGATDFGVLFLSFSFFLIVAALLLVGLLVRLNIDRRAGEIGLLLAIGWDHRKVRWLLLAEGAALALLGGLVGLAGATLYAHLMLRMLSFNWPGGEGLGFLRLHAEPTSFLIGYAASVLVSLLTLYGATRGLGSLSPRSLLHGDTQTSAPAAREKSGYGGFLAIFTLLLALAMMAIGIGSKAPAVQAAMFFCSGALLLTAALSAIWVEFLHLRHDVAPQPTLLRLGIRNAARNAVRSILTVGLLASAAFLIVAVESFHKDPDQHFYEKTGGSGGFAFFAEGSVPLFEDLNATEVRRVRSLDTPELRTLTVYPCRVQPGDDASCLNLYKPLKPRVMGVSPAMIERGGFAFSASSAETDAKKANPWLLLHKPGDDAMPAILDANTAQWILKVGLGETIDVKNDRGEDVKLRVVALLKESIFQSEVLIAEANFLKLYPRQEGATFFLFDVGPGAALTPETAATVQQQLTRGLDGTGLDVQTAASRLQNYLAVEAMYLKTFQALGGLGLALGAVGLSIVLLRGVWERRAELALLLALGFRPTQLAWLVLVENAFLLVLGLAAGTVAALLAVAPHLIGAGAQVLWLRIFALLALVMAIGMGAAGIAVWATLRTPVLTALRRE